MSRPLLAFLLLLAPAARAQDAPPDAEPPIAAPEPGHPSSGDPQVVIGAALGAGMVGQAETGWQPTLGLRVDAAVGLPAHFRIVAAFADGFHEQPYLSTAPGTAGTGSHVVTVFEQTIAAGLGVDWDIAPFLWWAPDDTHVRLGLSPWVVALDNAAFSTWLVALRLSLGVEVPLAKRLSVVGSGAFAPGLSRSPETLSALGLPQHAWDARVGLSEKFGAFAVTGSWNADGIVFERTHRVRHLAMVGLSFTH